jgi:hypothetical protein
MSNKTRVMLACLALGLVAPACSGKSTATPAPSGIVLLGDSFETFPNSNWSVSGTGVVFFNGFAGNLAPCLSTTPGHTSGAFVAVQSTTQFSAPDLTLSADMLLVEVGPGLGSASFAVRNFSGGSAVATASLDGQSGAMTFTIGGAVSAPIGTVPGWRTYSFSYSAGGGASWKVNGKVFFSVAGFLPPAAVVVSLENGSGSVFDFDNVLVTTP